MNRIQKRQYPPSSKRAHAENLMQPWQTNKSPDFQREEILEVKPNTEAKNPYNDNNNNSSPQM